MQQNAMEYGLYLNVPHLNDVAIVCGLRDTNMIDSRSGARSSQMSLAIKGAFDAFY